MTGETKEGSINMMYGPQGQLWDELDANGNPILKTPESKLTSDENVGLSDTIDPQSDLGIRRKLITDRIESEVPKMIMAKDEASAMKIYDDLIKFAEQNGITEIETAYDK